MHLGSPVHWRSIGAVHYEAIICGILNGMITLRGP